MTCKLAYAILLCCCFGHLTKCQPQQQFAQLNGTLQQLAQFTDIHFAIQEEPIAILIQTVRHQYLVKKPEAITLFQKMTSEQAQQIAKKLIENLIHNYNNKYIEKAAINFMQANRYAREINKPEAVKIIKIILEQFRQIEEIDALTRRAITRSIEQ